MIVLAGADLVLPDRVLPRASLFIEHDRIVAIDPRVVDAPAGARRLDVSDRLIVPGFIDVHVHGIEGIDTLDGDGAIAAIASRLPRYGVTSFCPTSVASEPGDLSLMLKEVRACRGAALGHTARVLPAHLESNFINPEYRGAQPLECLRAAVGTAGAAETRFSANAILAVLESEREAIGIVTLAPEIDGGFELIRTLRRAGHVVSVGHSGATYEQARRAIDAGVTHATHLFNRMAPLHHRAPGVAGAVLESPHVCAELICDGIHVHPALMAVAIRAKGSARVLAITDGTAGAGLPVGSVAKLGGRPIYVSEHSAQLEDGTLAGSVLTMDRGFRFLVQTLGISLVDAATMCATTPANQLGRRELGRIEAGAVADLAVLDRSLVVRTTILAGHLWRNSVPGGSV